MSPEDGLMKHEQVEEASVVNRCGEGQPYSRFTIYDLRESQTPDLPATHAVVATVAPFPAWRGSQDERCAEPEV